MSHDLYLDIAGNLTTSIKIVHDAPDRNKPMSLNFLVQGLSMD
jgi:hypothetical protein